MRCTRQEGCGGRGAERGVQRRLLVLPSLLLLLGGFAARELLLPLGACAQLLALFDPVAHQLKIALLRIVTRLQRGKGEAGAVKVWLGRPGGKVRSGVQGVGFEREPLTPPPAKGLRGARAQFAVPRPHPAHPQQRGVPASRRAVRGARCAWRRGAFARR